jgi:hypothetical protein
LIAGRFGNETRKKQMSGKLEVMNGIELFADGGIAQV